MKKIIIISIGVLVAIGIIMFVIFGLTLSKGTPPTSTDTGGPYTTPNTTTQVNPPGQSPGNTFSVATVGGGTLLTKDFKKDPATGQYPTPGYYYIGFHAPVDGTSASNTTATQDPPYIIQYVDTTQYFTVSLLQEPIAQTRKDVEVYLMQRLGITESQMCQLKYTLSVPVSVNAVYAGENLGFSFCPGAVQL